MIVIKAEKPRFQKGSSFGASDGLVDRITLPAAPWEAGYDLHAARAARKAAEAEREAVAAKFRAIGASRKTDLKCRKPRCEARLTEGNTTGLCRSHTHAIGLCQCSGCQSGGDEQAGAEMSEEEWGPWIEHDGKGCPCVGAVVLVQYRDSIIFPDEVLIAARECIKQGVDPNSEGSAWVWQSPVSDLSEIIRYRIRKPRGLAILESLLTNLPEKVDA